MIRIGEYKDVDQGVKLLEQHRMEFDFGKFQEDNTEYYRGLMKAIAKDRTAVISEDKDKIIDGVLLGMKIPNLLNPHITQLHLLLTWVHPDKRGSSIFYRMNKMLEKKIKNHKEVKDIIFYSIPKTNINFNKLNYKEFQSMYKKEV